MPELDLIELKRLTVIDIIDNESDGLSSPCSCMQPQKGIRKSDNIEDTRPCIYTQEIASLLERDGALHMDRMCSSAHGLSLLLIGEFTKNNGNNGEANNNDNSEDETIVKYLLFDGGPDPKLWSDNAQKLNIPLEQIDTVVLSHYHTDHSNGLRSAISEICKARRINRQSSSSSINMDHPVTIDLHSPVIEERGFKVYGKIYPMLPSNPSIEEFKSLVQNSDDNEGECNELMGEDQLKVSLHKRAHTVCDGCFYVSGKIPRTNSFETGLPGHFNRLKDGNWVPDADIMDERYVACKIRGRGIVVFSSCSHAGIINVCTDVMKRFKGCRLTSVVGGFHLSGSRIEGRIDETVARLKELNPDLLLAGHCTGWRAKAKLAEEFPFNFQPLAVGGRYIFNSHTNQRCKE